MANYFIKKQENKYHIMENATDQSVMTFDSYDAAKKQVGHLLIYCKDSHSRNNII